jgi:hypothetical protein
MVMVAPGIGWPADFTKPLCAKQVRNGINKRARVRIDLFIR